MFVIIALCIVLSVYVLFVLFCVFCVLYCIVVPLPPGTYPLAVNNNNKETKLRDTGQHLGGGWGNRENINSSRLRKQSNLLISLGPGSSEWHADIECNDGDDDNDHDYDDTQITHSVHLLTLLYISVLCPSLCLSRLSNHSSTQPPLPLLTLPVCG